MTKKDDPNAILRRGLARAKRGHGESRPPTKTDPDLVEMNEKFAVVQVGGKVRVVYFEGSLYQGCKLPVFQSVADFRQFHAKRRKSIANEAGGGTREVGIGSWWIAHPERRQFESIGYYPNENNPARLNLWQGFSCEPKPGDCSLYKRHVLDNICSGNADHFAYLLNWMAHGVQHPGVPPGTAVILKGKEGVGKGIHATCYGRCFGAHFRHVVHEKHLTGHFNSHLQQCSVLYADEAFFAGDRGHESTLKALITEETILIEPKGLDCYAVRNCIHLIMASNSDWVVPAGADARRFFVLDVADHKMQDTEYFGAIAREMESGGQAALLWELLHRDISTFDVRAVPQTAALAQQKQFSRRGVDQLIEIIADQGILPNVHAQIPFVAITTGEDRNRGFWAAARNLVPELKYRSSPIIARELRKNWGCVPWKSRTHRGVEFPTLAELRAMFDQRHGAQAWNSVADWSAHSDDTAEEEV